MSSRSQAMTQNVEHLPKKALETIKQSESEQTSFKQLVSTSKSYSETEKAVINFETFAQFDEFWRTTLDSKEGFDQSHERGCGLCSKNYQKSAVMAQSFMKDFSPIIDLVKDFAAPYGGAAVGTISVFFAVAGNKEDMEECLASAITAIKDRLPGLNMYQHIYNENHELDIELQDRIVSAYEGFIQFCIAASKYYTGGGPRRWLKALGRPNSILDKAQEVQRIIIEIRRLCDELLDKNVNLIKRLNLEQEKNIKELKNEIERLHIARDEDFLTEIQRLLSLTAFSAEKQRKELDQYRKSLESDEHLNEVYFEQMRGDRLDSFIACNEYQSWIKSENSSLLILSGHNNESIAYLDQCWLSPVAIATITEPRLSLSAYYVFTSQGELIYRALSVILLQLLRQKSQVLRNRSQYDELRSELEELQEYELRDNEIMKTEDKRLSAFHKVALRVFGFFDESETVHVVLDRADRCCNLKTGVDHRRPLLKTLVKMVEAARCKLRVLMVVYGNQWNVKERVDDLEEKIKGKIILLRAEQGCIA